MSVALFLFLKFLFNILIFLLLESNNVKLTLLSENLYFFGKALQIFLKNNSFFFIFFDQAFSLEKTFTLIIFRIGFNNF